MISYLAAPYSSIHIHLRDRRHQQIAFVAAELIKRGEVIYSPITAVTTSLMTSSCLRMPPFG
jgi:hypothetical protein